MAAKRMLFAVFLFALCAIAAQAKVYLVSVGIADYPGTANDLRLPAKDAQTIAALYNRQTSLVCRQFLNSRATLDDIVRAMETLYAHAGEKDMVVFFFSGHGYQGGFYTYDKKLSYDRIRKAMARSNSKYKMIFADACFSGKMRTSGKTSEPRETGDGKNNVMLFLSSRSNESSIEHSGMANGFFTTYLQSGLRGAADTDGDRIVTAKELFNYVRAGVTKISGGKQHPVMWGNFPDNLPVMIY